MNGYNLPDGMSASDKDAPWNQTADDEEVARQDKVDLLREAVSYLNLLIEVLKTIEDSYKGEFYLEIRRIADIGLWTHDRMKSLTLLRKDLENWVQSLTPRDGD